MGTSKDDIRFWLEMGKSQGATHVIIVCDTYDYEDFSVLVMPDEDVREKELEYSNSEKMQKVMEVYNLSMDFEEQINGDRFTRNY